MGCSELELDAENLNTVSDVWNAASKDMEMPVNILCAVNMDYVSTSESVKDGDEVAFFPPVTGG